MRSEQTLLTLPLKNMAAAIPQWKAMKKGKSSKQMAAQNFS